MSFFSSTEFKVGALVVIMGGLIAFMSMQVSDNPSYLGRDKKVWFLIPNANGLIKGSAIKSAGIPVGVIKDIRLQDGLARVDINVNSELGLKRSGSVEVKSNGILGDKYVDVNPGMSSDPEIEDGGQILNVSSGGGLDDAMGQISEIATSLKEASKVLSESVSNDGTEKHILGRVVKNIEKITANLSEITEDNKGKINQIVDQVNRITKTVDTLVNDESEQGFKKVWANAMVRIDKSLKNIEDITNKINNGEGTIGKLVSDEKTAEQVSAAIEGIGGMLDTANRMTTSFDFNGYYLGELNQTRSSIGVQIQPGLDRYYYLGLVSDPLGVVEKTDYKYTNPVSEVTEYEEMKTYKNKTKFTALFAKNIYDFTIKGGMMENTGGVGIDYSTFDRKLVTSIEAFDFESFQLRANMSYRFKYGLYLTGGYNDILNKRSARSYFAGAGLFLTNDDLKLLLTRF